MVRLTLKELAEHCAVFDLEAEIDGDHGIARLYERERSEKRHAAICDEMERAGIVVSERLREAAARSDKALGAALGSDRPREIVNVIFIK